MTPLGAGLLLIVLGATWLIAKEVPEVLRELSHVLPPHTVYEVVLLAAVGIWAAWRSAMLMISSDQGSVLPVAGHWAVAAIALLAALYRSRQS